MKRTLAILLALTLSLGAVSCGKGGDKPSDQNGEETSENNVSYAPLDVLKKVWENCGDDEKFPSTGGDFGEEIVEGPGAYAELNAEVLDSVLGFPAASIDKIDSAASYMHMMNANTFTGGAYHVKDTADIDALATALRDNIQARMWMCGFPDTLIVASVGDVVISVFGKKVVVDPFVNKLTELYSDAKVIINEPIE